jgi:hypothetical protein
VEERRRGEEREGGCGWFGLVGLWIDGWGHGPSVGWSVGPTLLRDSG